jgi:hypothetical protein
MSGATPELAELMRAAAENALTHVHVSVPGVVKSYDAATRTCTVQPLITKPLATESGAIVYERFEAVQNVPVLFRGSAAFSEHFTLAAGDTVELLFQDFSIAQWRARGEVSDPADIRQHGPSYPVAIPWYRPAGAPGELDPAESMGKPGGLRLHFGTSAIGAGDQSDFVAMAAKTEARLTAIENFLNTLVLPVSGASAGPPGTPLTPGDAVASTNLKAD